VKKLQSNPCVIDNKRTFGSKITHKITVFLDSLQIPLDNLGYLVSPSIIKLRPFIHAPKIELAYLRTTMYEIWFPYLPFYRFSPRRDFMVIKGERLTPNNSAVDQFADILDEMYSERYIIDYTPSQIPSNMIFAKCTNPPEEEHYILQRKEFAEKVLYRFFKQSDLTADRFDELLMVIDNYLEKFHTNHIPILYYTLAGAAGDFELLTALISAVAGAPEALGLETLATKGDILRATTALSDRQKRLASILPGSKDKDVIIESLQSEVNKYKRYFQELQQRAQQGGTG